MKKQYIELLNGTIFREQGWTEEELDQFVDDFTEVVEKHGGQMACGYKLCAEDEME